MLETDRVRLRHMLDSSREAVRFGAGHTPEDIADDRVLALALVRCIEIVGEAASRVTQELRASHPEVPWVDIIAMRNRLIHAYFDIDSSRVCDTIAADLPPLIAQLERILS